MKILLSSKNLANNLLELDLLNEQVISVEIVDTYFHVNTKSKSAVIRAEVFDGDKNMVINQQSVRWDWIKDLVSKVSEQPITLNINENLTEVIFQY